MCRSPLALIARSMREWRASRSSMWSRKPIPVAIADVPLPSRSIATSTSVSLVVRLTTPLRMESMPSRLATARLLSADRRVRHCRRDRAAAGWRGAAAMLKSFPALEARMQPSPELWHGTTILSVRKGGAVVIGGDGQVSIGQTIVKANAKKVRRLGKGDVIGGFAGATADAFTLFERLEAKLEQY